MLPYTIQHLEYGLATLLIVGALYWLTARPRALRSHVAVRFLVVLAQVGVGTIFLFLAIVHGLGRDGSNGFTAVAFGLYGGAYVLPLLTVIEVLRRRPGQRGRILALCLALSAVGTGLYSQTIELNRVQVRRETLAIARWTSNTPLRLVHISDLQTVGPAARHDDALDLIRSADPDLIVITGDYIAGPYNNIFPAIREARRFLSGLRAKYGIVVVAGHSDSEAERAHIFAGLDLIYLRDETRIIECGEGREVRVFGATVERPELRQLREFPRDHRLNLLVSHVPDLALEVGESAVDLHLAGHTHGGQIVVPGYGAPVTLSSLPRRYARGLHPFEHFQLNVSAGLGSEGNHAPRVRLFCPPEICSLDIHPMPDPLVR